MFLWNGHAISDPFRQAVDGVPSVRSARVPDDAWWSARRGVGGVSTRRGSRPRSAIANWVSLALFGLAAVLFVVVAVLYVRDRGSGAKLPPTPASVPGKAQSINVLNALKVQGIKAGFSGGGARSDALSPPGQALTADGHPLYVFIYEDPASREAETAGLDVASLDLLDIRGSPVAGGAPHAVGGSNVYAVLLGGDQALAAKVDRAIQGLP